MPVRAYQITLKASDETLFATKISTELEGAMLKLDFVNPDTGGDFMGVFYPRLIPMILVKEVTKVLLKDEAYEAIIETLSKNEFSAIENPGPKKEKQELTP